MAASPQLAFDSLVKSLNKLVDDDNPNLFLLKKAEKEALALAKTDVHASFIARGIIACIKLDAAGVREYHEKSLIHSSNAFTKLQYAYSLNNVSQSVDALKIYEEVFEIEKDDLVVIGRMIDAAIYSLNFFRARDLILVWEKMHHQEEHSDRGLVTEVVELMESLNLTDVDMIFTQNALMKVLESGYRIKARKFAVLEEDGYRWLDIEFALRVDVNEIVNLNLSFADEVVMSGAPSIILDRIIVRFSGDVDAN